MKSRSQLAILESVMSDGRPHSAYELAQIIAEEKYGGSDKVGHGLRIGARIWDLRHRPKNPLNIKSWTDPNNPQKEFYQLVPVEKVVMAVDNKTGQILFNTDIFPRYTNQR